MLLKDLSVSGHTCKVARRIGRRGCCRTGVEFRYYDKDANELCIMCEVEEVIAELNAETCDEAYSETRVGYNRDGDGDDSDDEEEGGVLLRGEGAEERDGGKGGAGSKVSL